MMRTTVPLFAASLFLFAGCSSEAASMPQPKELHFSVLPDFSKAPLAETAKQLEVVLTKKLGVPVHYEPSTDYTMAVNSLISNKVDFVWLGGKTTVDAIDAGKGAVHVICARDIDLHFKSYFIANQKVVEAGKVKPMTDLKDLAAVAKDLTFTFGDKNSTSGHLMPRFFLTEAGIDPSKSFKGEAGYQASGSHSATLKAVVSGAADLGALNYAYYDAAKAEDKAAAPIVFTTPEYVDYAWVGHNRIGDAMLKKIGTALTTLDESVPEEKAILEASKGKKFVLATDSQWESIRKVRDSLPKDFLK